VYFVQSGLGAPKTPDDEDWELDYDTDYLNLRFALGTEEILNYGGTLSGPDGGPRWVQHMLVVFDQMSGDARARLNEARLYLAQTQIDNSGLGDLDTITAPALAKRIFTEAGTTTTLTTLPNAEWRDGLIGEHATAIAPYPQVLDDLARITGFVMDWSFAGTPTWEPDMWWSIGMTDVQAQADHLLDATYLRGQVQYAGHRPNEGAVRVRARTPDGLHTYAAEYPASGVVAGTQYIEFDDLVVSSVEAARWVALNMYYKSGLGWQTGAQEITFTLKGAGEWLKPDLYISLATYSGTGVTANRATATAYSYNEEGWLLDRVTWEWGRSEAFRSWKATAHGQRFWK
jgi:hypothetical protein